MTKQVYNQFCLACRYFYNNPVYLESTLHGLSVLSSAWASVRKDDGICKKHDLYLTATAYCENFEIDPSNSN